MSYRAFAYVRDGEGLPHWKDQLKAIEDWCASSDIQIEQTFIENGVGQSRQMYNDMLRTARELKPDTLVSHSVSAMFPDTETFNRDAMALKSEGMCPVFVDIMSKFPTKDDVEDYVSKGSSAVVDDFVHTLLQSALGMNRNTILDNLTKSFAEDEDDDTEDDTEEVIQHEDPVIPEGLAFGAAPYDYVPLDSEISITYTVMHKGRFDGIWISGCDVRWTSVTDRGASAEAYFKIGDAIFTGTYTQSENGRTFTIRPRDVFIDSDTAKSEEGVRSVLSLLAEFFADVMVEGDWILIRPVISNRESASQDVVKPMEGEDDGCILPGIYVGADPPHRFVKTWLRGYIEYSVDDLYQLMNYSDASENMEIRISGMSEFKGHRDTDFSLTVNGAVIRGFYRHSTREADRVFLKNPVVWVSPAYCGLTHDDLKATYKQVAEALEGFLGDAGLDVFFYRITGGFGILDAAERVEPDGIFPFGLYVGDNPEPSWVRVGVHGFVTLPVKTEGTKEPVTDTDHGTYISWEHGTMYDDVETRNIRVIVNGCLIDAAYRKSPGKMREIIVIPRDVYLDSDVYVSFEDVRYALMRFAEYIGKVLRYSGWEFGDPVYFGGVSIRGCSLIGGGRHE